MTGSESEHRRNGDCDEGRVSEGGREWLRRWGKRLRDSVSLRLHEGLDDLDCPEEVSEQTVRQELAEKATILGAGLDRIVIVPPEYVTPEGEGAAEGSEGELVPFLNGGKMDVDDVVVKLSRPTEPGCEGGIKQNRAEERVWDALMNNELYRFDSVTGTKERIKSSWFAPVVDIAEDHSWILMKRFDDMVRVAEDEDEREEAVTAMEARFLEADLRPDLSPGNIGVRDDGEYVIIDYGWPNWVGEERLW